jgi:hypothetical protein
LLAEIYGMHLYVCMYWLIKPMGWDYVSELQPLRAYCSFPRWYMWAGEPWWNDVNREKLIHPPESSLAILPAESSSSKSGGSGQRKWWILFIKYLFYTHRVLWRVIGQSCVTLHALLPFCPVNGRLSATFSTLQFTIIWELWKLWFQC